MQKLETEKDIQEALTTLYQEKEYYRDAWLTTLDREAALKEQNEHLQENVRTLQSLYDAVLNAFWWRITAPLRRLTERLRPAPVPTPQTPPAQTETAEEVIEFIPESVREELSPNEAPLVSILIPNREHTEDLSACIESIFSRSSYRNFEIIIAENGSFTNTIFRYYENIQRQQSNVRVVRWDSPFNFSAIINFAAKEARGEYLLLLNNDTEIVSPHWLEEMLLLARRKDMGPVGALLRYPDGSIQHAGMSVSSEHPNRHIGRGESPENPAFRRMRYVDAVTGACLMLRRSLWEELGGLDETFEVAFNDVDLCMRAREKGYRCAFTPYAELYHYEAKSRSADDSPEKLRRFLSEMRRFRIRWLT